MAEMRARDEDDEFERTYDDEREMAVAFIGAVLLGAVIISLFMFITWLAYNTD